MDGYMYTHDVCDVLQAKCILQVLCARWPCNIQQAIWVKGVTLQDDVIHQVC
jgi:hypothetical protein